MQKEDIQWAVLGILILLVIALVIKPMATGQPVNLGLPAKTTPTTITTTPPVTYTTIAAVTTPAATVTSQIPTPVPTPAWNGTIQFVDPSTYKVNFTDSGIKHSPIGSDNASLRSTLVTCATISGQYSGTTRVFYIPYPYWEMWYSVEPMSSDIRQQAKPGGQYVVTPTKGQGASESGFAGSYSTAMPTFSILVMDADDPNRIVRTISPAGSLDPSLWTKDDPRPWKEKFFEGQRSYYLIVQSSLLKSYTIYIKFPTTYLNRS